MEGARGFEVRPLEAEDIPNTAALQALAFPALGARPVAEVERKLRALCIESPYCSDGLSFVAVDGSGRQVGFRAALRRKWRFQGETVMVTTGSGVAVHPEMRQRGVAHEMVEASRARARALGLEHTFHLADRTAPSKASIGFGSSNGDEYLAAYAFGWAVPLRRSWLEALRGRRGRAPAVLADRVLQQGPLGADGLGEVLTVLGGEREPYFAPDPESLTWLLDYMANYPSRGRFEARLLRDDGRPVGFFAGYLLQGRFELVAFGACRAHERSARVEALATARELGAQQVVGSASAWQLRALLEVGASIRPGTPLALRESSAEIRQRFRAGESLVTGLEGEAWI